MLCMHSEHTTPCSRGLTAVILGDGMFNTLFWVRILVASIFGGRVDCVVRGMYEFRGEEVPY